MKRWLALIGATLLFVAFASVVSAHAKADQCTPVGGSTVATAPSQVVCVMTEEIDTKASTMSVFDANNVQMDNKDAHVDLSDPDHKTLVVSLTPSKIKNGIYTVKWHTVTPDDGGITDATFQFIVGSAAVTPQPTVEIIQEATATPSGATQGATPTTAATAVATTANAATATSAAPTNAPTTESNAAATPTAAPPTTVPTTGAPENNAWLVVVALGLLMVFAGVGLAVKVRQ